jgi:hypothetical protein
MRSPIEAMQIIFIRVWLRTICDVLLLFMLMLLLLFVITVCME